MKKVGLFLLVFFFGVGLASAQLTPNPVPCPKKWFLYETLWAGQTMNAGEFIVWSTADSLWVKVYPNPGWYITEAHIDVSTSPVGDKPGKFGWKFPVLYSKVDDCWEQDPFDGCPTTDALWFTIPYADIGEFVGLGSELYMAVHAVVVKGNPGPCMSGGTYDGDCDFCVTQNETAWGGRCASEWPDGPSQIIMPPNSGPPTFLQFYPFDKGWGWYFSFIVRDDLTDTDCGNGLCDN